MKNSKKKENLKDIKNVSTKNVKSNLNETKKVSTKNVVSNTTKNVKSNSVPTYTPVSKHIYNTGVSYRVRVYVKGKMVSITTPTKKEAFRVRKELLGLRG
jgi:hypothetical protein